MGGFALIPEVVDIVKLPVKAAGASLPLGTPVELVSRFTDMRNELLAFIVCMQLFACKARQHSHVLPLVYRSASREQRRQGGHHHLMVGDCIRFETLSTKDRRVFCWKILVDFELQALISSGKSTVPSRVHSAAYANAASISGSVSAA
jgi:hypothetical protein